jgi:hypothetical protein
MLCTHSVRSACLLAHKILSSSLATFDFRGRAETFSIRDRAETFKKRASRTTSLVSSQLPGAQINPVQNPWAQGVSTAQCMGQRYGEPVMLNGFVFKLCNAFWGSSKTTKLC